MTLPLPPLPFEFQQFIDSPDISSLSCVFNLIFSFVALETEGIFLQWINMVLQVSSPQVDDYIIGFVPL